MAPHKKGLQAIPGVGPSLAADLRSLGLNQAPDLRGLHPTRIYEQLCARTGVHQDRCVLYVFRCAVYFASTDNPKPELLKWWAWKDAAREAWLPHVCWREEF